MKCPRCGNENPATQKFCGHCGAALPLTTAPQVESSAVPKRPPVGERKLLTVLFADVVGSTAMAEWLDPEEVTEIMNGAFAFLNSAVAKYGGTVARLMGDGILAFFGAPVAHEDDAERAVRAGLDIQESANAYARDIQQHYGLDFHVRVGINTGVAVLDMVGDQTKTEYTAMGDTTNVASRMQSAAEPGTVLFSAETYRLVKNLFAVKPRGALEVKGKSAPIDVYEVIGAKSLPGKVRGVEGLSSPLVGRDGEFRSLRDKVESLREGQGAFVAVIGEAGIGKSRLLAELRKRDEPVLPVPSEVEGSAVEGWHVTCFARDEGQVVSDVLRTWQVTSEESDAPSNDITPSPVTRHVRSTSLVQWLEGRAISYGQSISYYPWRQVIRQAIGAQEGDSPATVREKLHLECGPDCCALADGDVPFLEALLAVESEKTLETVRGLEGSALVQRMTDATRAYMCSMAQRMPLVLVFDDLHWADDASLNLLLNISDLVGRYPLLVVCVLRPDKDAPSSSLLERVRQNLGSHFADIALQPLTDENSRELLGNLLYIEDLPDSVRELILTKSEGNPFFIEEVIRALIDSQHIVRENSHWRAVGEIVNVSIPSTLAGVLNARIDRLPDDTKQVTQVAAVIGRIFAYRVLQAIHESAAPNQRVEALAPHLALLVRDELVRERPHAAELEYIFKHALTHEAAYNSMLLRRRKEYHRRSGSVLEQLYPERLDELAPVIAHHFWQGEDWLRAAAHAMRAGEGAMKVYALHEAMEHYQRALDALDKMPAAPPEQLVDSTLGWCRAAMKVKPYAELVERLTRAEKIARELNDKRRLAQVLHWLANVHFAHGYNTRAVPALFENYRLANEIGDERLSVIPSYWMAFFMVDRDPRGALEQFKRVIELARKYHDREIEAHAIATQAFAHGRLGEFAQAEAELQQAFEMVQSINSPIKEADVNNLAAFTYLDMGDAERGIEYGQRGADKAMAANALECASAGLMAVGFCHLQSQKLSEAQNAFDRSMRLAESRGADAFRNQAWSGLAVAQFFSGRAEAINDMESALANARAIDDEYGIAFLAQMLGEAYTRTGEFERAQNYLDAALEYYRRSQMRPYLVRALESVSTLYERQGRKADAERARAEADQLKSELIAAV